MSGSLPRGDGMSPEAQRARFQRIETGVAHEGHPLTLLVPRRWAEMPLPETAPAAMNGLRLIAFWSSEGSTPAPLSLQVFVGTFGREIAADHYLRRFTEAMRYQVLQLQPHSPSLADSLVAFHVDGLAFHGRLVLRLYGPLVVAVLASGPSTRYDEAADLFGFLVRAASVEGASTGGPMEPRASIRLNARLGCDMPGSWTPTPLAGPDALRGATDFDSAAPDGTPIGQIRLKWMHASLRGDPASTVAKLGQELEESGLLIGPETYSLNPAQRPPQAGAFVVRADVTNIAKFGTGMSLELRRTVLEGPGFTVAARSLCAERVADLTGWACTRRALEIALGSLAER